MKNLNYFPLILLLVVVSSCSNQEAIESDQDNTIQISHYVHKSYDLSGNVIRTIEYSLENNKIMNSLSTVFATSQTANSIYTYSDDKLTTISNYSNGSLTSQSNYQYNANNDLVEMRQNSFNTANQITTIQKHTFTHTSDTIFSQWSRSTDGGATYSNIANFKIVLDQNNNRVFLEEHNITDGNTDRIVSTYDSNNNLINEQYFSVFADGQTTQYPTNTYTYTNQINPLAIAFEATYQRKTLMMLYHLQTNAINQINARNISPNSIQTFITDLGDGTVTFEIDNIPFNTEYTKSSDYKTFYSGSLYARFGLEYFFE
ncbi:hypothetical protein [Flavobacterium sp.]|uniref:hypothetical protein n=1 Tax=Flavobacterium sp. TaxID=239 RepID=UPI002B4AE182|nr:hypothetical protein [Flavobacterium sp.]HLP65656.1 hypothetical protein [Flavobacterium sp.]